MGCRKGIVAGIFHHVMASDAPDFRRWRIGLTNHVAETYRAWRWPGGFMAWRVDTRRDAQAIEAYFTRRKGMIGGVTGKLDPDAAACVCLFRAP